MLYVIVCCTGTSALIHTIQEVDRIQDEFCFRLKLAFEASLACARVMIAREKFGVCLGTSSSLHPIATN